MHLRCVSLYLGRRLRNRNMPWSCGPATLSDNWHENHKATAPYHISNLHFKKIIKRWIKLKNAFTTYVFLDQTLRWQMLIELAHQQGTSIWLISSSYSMRFPDATGPSIRWLHVGDSHWGMGSGFPVCHSKGIPSWRYSTSSPLFLGVASSWPNLFMYDFCFLKITQVSSCFPHTPNPQNPISWIALTSYRHTQRTFRFVRILFFGNLVIHRNLWDKTMSQGTLLEASNVLFSHPMWTNH